MKPLVKLSFVFATLLFVACAGPSKNLSKEGCIPEWFLNVPKDPNYFYAAKTDKSQDLQLALDKATASARAEIAKQVEAHVKTLEKKFNEEVGNLNNPEVSQHFSSVIKIIASTTLTGSRVIKRQVCEKENGYQAYVLLEYPLGAANKALVEQIRKDKILYDRYRASKGYDELDKEVQKLDQNQK